MMRRKMSAAMAVMLAVSVFTACGENAGEGGQPGGGPGVSADTGQSVEALLPAQMETEARLREGLAALGSTPDVRAERLAFYEELLARDLCREEDYLEMAQLYAEAGDAAAQRRMLWWAFRLYPDEKYVQQLQELVVRYTAEEEPAVALTAALRQALTDRDAAALRAVAESEDWKETFQEAPEIFATRTCYESGEFVAQIESDAYETEVFLLDADGACLYGRLNETGCLIASTVFADGTYNGAAEVCWFDAESVLYKRYQALLEKNICVDSVSVEYEGVTYTGALGEDGAVMEEQQEKVARAGGVVYAYQEGGNRFLYQEGADINTFRMDCESLGLPRVEVWQQESF